jgi:O-antigen ligase
MVKNLVVSRFLGLLEVAPLIVILSLLPFFHDLSIPIPHIIFFSFPFFYLPIILFRKRQVPNTIAIIMKAWYFLIFVQFISLFFSASITLSIPPLFETIGYFTYFLLILIVVNKPKDINLLQNSILFVSIVLSIMSIYFVAYPPKNIGAMNLVYATYGHNHLADYLIFSLPISIYYWLNQNKSWRQIIFGLIMIFLFLSSYLTFSRTLMLITPLISLAIVYNCSKSLKRSIFIMIFGLIPWLVLALLFINSITYREFEPAEKDKTLDAWLSRQTIKPILHDARFSYYQQAIKGFLEHPLLGYGPGTFRLISQKYLGGGSYSWYTHSNILQILSETGLIGFLANYFLLYKILSEINFKIVKKCNYFPLYIGSIGSFLQSFFTYNLQFLIIQLLFFVSLACIYRISSKKQIVVHSQLKLILFIFSVLCLLMGVSTIFTSFINQRVEKIESVNSKKELQLYKFSLFLPSFKTNKFVHYIQFVQSKQLDIGSELFQKLAWFWNKKDPYYLLELGNYLINAQPEIAKKYIMQAYNLAPSELSFALPAASFSLNQYKDENFTYSQILKPGWYVISNHIPTEIVLQLKDVTEKDENVLTNEELRNLIKQPIYPEELYYAKLYYFIGLAYYNRGNYETSLKFWWIASQLVPEWSLYHLELANLYHLLGDNQKALDVLDTCISRKWPKRHCVDYARQIERSGFQEPGSFQKDIRNIH